MASRLISKTVFVLGAGASKQAGAPLMKEFLDAAELVLRSGEAGLYEGDFNLVLKGVEALQLAHSKATLDLDNIESVFAAFEMAQLFGRPLGGLSGEDTERLVTALQHVMAHTLERTISYKIDNESITPPAPYGEFTKLLDGLADASAAPDVITFNYDVALEYALHFASMPFDYCLDDSLSGAKVTKVLKLHGSLNWARCRSCSAIVPLMPGNFKWRFPRISPTLPAQQAPKKTRLELTPDLKGLSHGGHGPCHPEPMLVSPTWNKGQHYQTIAAVWRRAAAELALAENIIIIGYSLPETDHFFRYLYALGTMGGARLRKFFVFNPDSNVKARFDTLLGQAARDRFDFRPNTFSAAVGMLLEALSKGRLP